MSQTCVNNLLTAYPSISRPMSAVNEEIFYATFAATSGVEPLDLAGGQISNNKNYGNMMINNSAALLCIMLVLFVVVIAMMLYHEVMHWVTAMFYIIFAIFFLYFVYFVIVHYIVTDINNANSNVQAAYNAYEARRQKTTAYTLQGLYAGACAVTGSVTTAGVGSTNAGSTNAVSSKSNKAVILDNTDSEQTSTYDGTTSTFDTSDSSDSNDSNDSIDNINEGHCGMCEGTTANVNASTMNKPNNKEIQLGNLINRLRKKL